MGAPRTPKKKRSSRRERAHGFIHVSGPSGKALEKFYRRMFGDAALGDFGEGPIVVGEARGAATRPAFFIRVDSVENALRAVEKAGGRVALAVVELPAGAGRIAAICDPAGNELGLWSPAGKPRKTRARATTRRAPPKR